MEKNYKEQRQDAPATHGRDTHATIKAKILLATQNWK
jgi:hypothetical protein